MEVPSRQSDNNPILVLGPIQLRNKINLFSSSVNSPAQNENKINEAFKILGINRSVFEKISTYEARNKFLIYQLMLFEFVHRYESEEYFNLVDTAFVLILGSELMKSTALKRNVPGGLKGLAYGHVRIIKQEETGEGASIPTLTEIRVSKKKDKGVEPGVYSNDYSAMMNGFFNSTQVRSSRLAAMRQHADFGSFANSLEGRTNIIKGNYDNIGDDGVAKPEYEDIARSGTLQALKKLPLPYFINIPYMIGLAIYQAHKSETVSQMNRSAIREVLSTDLARLYGMSVHDQTLSSREVTGKKDQFLLGSTFVKNARELGPLYGPKAQSYCAQPLLFEQSGIKHVSVNPVNSLPSFFAILAVIGDRDKVGSQGQNLLQKDGKLFGIDFGHAFAAKNPLIGSLKYTFKFKAASFKNYSIFTDTNRRELMQGVLKLAIWQGQVEIPKSTRQSYGASFESEVASMNPGDDLKIFEDYISFCQARMNADGVSKSRKEEYRHLIAEVRKNKEIYKKNRDQLLKIFQPYLKLPAPVHDTLENFEKLCAADRGYTTLRSDNVLLQHVKVNRNPVQSWKITQCDDKTIIIKAKFKSGREAEKALKAIRGFTSESDSLPEGVTIKRRKTKKGAAIQINLPSNKLEEFNRFLSEEKIKKRYHAKDYKLGINVRSEVQLQTDLSNLSQFGVKYELAPVNKKKKDKFSITFSPKDDQGFSVKFLQSTLEKSGFRSKLNESNCFKIEFEKKDITKLSQALSFFEKFYIAYKNAQDGLSDVIRKAKEEFKNVNLQLTLEPSYKSGYGYVFELMINVPDAGFSKKLIITTEDESRALTQLGNVWFNVRHTLETQLQNTHDFK